MADEVLLPALKDRLWEKMRADLQQFVPEIAEQDVLMCCTCGRFLPREDFNIEHLIPRQTLKLDPETVRKDPETPANVRSGTFLLCKKRLLYNGKQLLNNGCNSWKGKYYDGPLTIALTRNLSKSPNNRITNSYIIGGLALGYLAMVAEYGYIVTLMRSGLLMREQFFNPNRFCPGLALNCQMMISGEPFTDPTAGAWKKPFSFWIEGESCLVTVRNFGVRLPISRDPRLPFAQHLKIVPNKYKLRPQFGTVFS